MISGYSEVGVEVKILFKDVKDAIYLREVCQFLTGLLYCFKVMLNSGYSFKVSELRQYQEDPEKGAFIGTGYSLNEMGKLLHESREKLPGL